MLQFLVLPSIGAAAVVQMKPSIFGGIESQRRKIQERFDELVAEFSRRMKFLSAKFTIEALAIRAVLQAESGRKISASVQNTAQYLLGADADRMIKELFLKLRSQVKGVLQVLADEEEQAVITVVWDPRFVSESDYCEIISALGDIIRESGGMGVVRIGSDGIDADVRQGANV